MKVALVKRSGGGYKPGKGEAVLTRHIVSRQEGLTIIEVVISVAIMAILGLAVLQGLSALARGQGKVSERVGALVAARSQVEAVKQAAYDGTVTAEPGPAYTSLPTSRTVGDMPFELAITAQQIETDVQLVTVSASTDGAEIVRVQTYKVNR